MEGTSEAALRVVLSLKLGEEGLGLGERNLDGGDSVLPADLRFSAPGCWAIGETGGRDTDTLGAGPCVSVCVCVCKGETDRLIGPSITTVTAEGCRCGGVGLRASETASQRPF